MIGKILHPNVPSSCSALLGALILLLATCSGWTAAQTNVVVAAQNPSGEPLTLLNREVFVFGSALGPYQPRQRAAAAETLIKNVEPRPGTNRVSMQMNGANAEILVYGQVVFLVTPGDVDVSQGESLESTAARVVRRLDTVLTEMEELRDRGGLLLSIIKGIFGTAVLAGLLWLLSRNRRWLEGRLIRLTADKADNLKSHTLRILGLQNVVPILRGLMTIVFWAIVLLATYIWLELLLQLFPETRPIGEQLSTRFVHLLVALGQSIVRALPNLGIVFLVWMLARFAGSAVRRFFAAVGRGHIKSRLFDPTTVPITQRLCVLMIWVIAIIVAFPYIPGSQTPAFRGISVLTGLMISIGSASVVAQLVGGLILVYNRTCHVGDYVRVGEHEGTMSHIGFFSSRLTTVRNEEIVVPNSQITGGALINYSRMNQTTGVALPVKVSIGYNTPWRQVQAMLLEAARRTAGVKQEPVSTVLQTELGDFYVEYQLNAILENPEQRVAARSELHANILDVFNEHGVQIMSPHYMADPPQAVTVPKDKFFQPPAAPPA